MDGFGVKSLIVPPIKFPRCFKPKNNAGRPEIIGFWDGSDEAYSGVCYVRWKLDGKDEWETNLITSKARVTPKSGCTTPRSELSGLVLLVRLIDQILSALDNRPIRITLAGDSTCTVSVCSINSASLQPFFQNRVIEVLHRME